MDVVRSVAGVPIRLTDERWAHVLVGHPELTDGREAVLVALEHPQSVMTGRDGVLLAVRPVDDRKWIVVAYVENNASDGFVLTAYVTRRDPTRGRETSWSPS
jgi:hypothetical protein